MRRRRFLVGLTLGTVGLGGCASTFRNSDSGETTISERSTQQTVRPSDVDLPVPESELIEAAPRDGIPAITDPAFGSDWSGLELTVSRSVLNGQDRQVTIEPRLSPSDEVIGVVRDGVARAYPLSVLRWHEVVNDSLAGPLVVTYCPLCGSAITAERRVTGEPTRFGVSGLLWRSDLVMYDTVSETLWSQLIATAIRGPRTGETLTLVPSTLTTLASWRDTHPDTEVLLPPPESETVTSAGPFDYVADRYARYRASRQLGLGPESEADGPHPKTQVLGVAVNGTARAYPYPAVREAGVVNDTVGGRPVVVATVPDEGASALRGTLVGYDRRVDGQKLTFTPDGPEQMRAGGTQWKVATGRGLDGPYADGRLVPLDDARTTHWFAWKEFYPDTDRYGAGDDAA